MSEPIPTLHELAKMALDFARGAEIRSWPPGFKMRDDLIAACKRIMQSAPDDKPATSRSVLGGPAAVKKSWQCSGCGWAFPGPWRKVCPACYREDFWTGSVFPDAAIWPPALLDALGDSFAPTEYHCGGCGVRLSVKTVAIGNDCAACGQHLPLAATPSTEERTAEAAWDRLNNAAYDLGRAEADAPAPSPRQEPEVYADPDAANQAFNDLRRERDVALARAEVLRTALRDLTAECTDDPDEDDWRYQRAIERAEKLLAPVGFPDPEQCPHCNRAVTEAISTAGCKGHHLSAPVCEDCKGGGWRTIRTWMGDGIGWQEQAVNCWCGTPPAPAPPPRQEPGAVLGMPVRLDPTLPRNVEFRLDPPAPRQEQEKGCPVERCRAGMLLDASGREQVSCPVCDGTLTPEMYRTLVEFHRNPDPMAQHTGRPAQADGGGHG